MSLDLSKATIARTETDEAMISLGRQQFPVWDFIGCKQGSAWGLMVYLLVNNEVVVLATNGQLIRKYKPEELDATGLLIPNNIN